MDLPLGQLVTTPAVLDKLAEMQLPTAHLLEYVGRHIRGDWGEVDNQDWWANDMALINGSRLLSAYRFPDGTKLWIITEADRSATTILLPEDY